MKRRVQELDIQKVKRGERMGGVDDGKGKEGA